MELKATVKIILSYFETYKYTLARSVLTALSEFKSDLFPIKSIFTDDRPCLSISVIHLGTFLNEFF